MKPIFKTFKQWGHSFKDDLSQRDNKVLALGLFEVEKPKVAWPKPNKFCVHITYVYFST